MVTTVPTRQRPEVQANQRVEDIKTRTIINETRRGKLNCLGQVTLTANSATTTLLDDLISTNSRLALMPRTANAKAEGIPYQDDPTPGSVVLNHANNAQTDRTYDYAVLG